MRPREIIRALIGIHSDLMEYLKARSAGKNADLVTLSKSQIELKRLQSLVYNLLKLAETSGRNDLGRLLRRAYDSVRLARTHLIDAINSRPFGDLPLDHDSEVKVARYYVARAIVLLRAVYGEEG